MANSKIHVTLCAAMSLDGKIATNTGDSALSSKSDLIRVHKLRAKHDAILVGINTVRTDNPLLTVRYTRDKNPIRIILDTKASISILSRIVKTSNKVRTIIIVSNLASQSRIKRLQKYGITVIVLRAQRINVKTLMTKLQDYNIGSILLEGGSTINWEFVRHDLIDDAIICIVPRILGGSSSASLVGGAGFRRVNTSLKMRLQNYTKRGTELILHYSKL